MDGVMNDEVHGQSNHPKMGGPQKINICETSGSEDVQKQRFEGQWAN
jgi:hypothetical protein